MPSLESQLQERAVEFAKSGNFGPDALQTNLELTRIAPANEGAWTRLARCYFESGQLDEATACAPGFLDRYVEACRASAPFMRFLAEAVAQPWK